MMVQVRLFANLKDFVPGTRYGSVLQIELGEGVTLKDLAHQLNLPQELVKLTYVNGVSQEMDYLLHDQDEIGIFPPIGGG